MKIEDFAFNKKVADVFDDMLNRGETISRGV